MNTKYTSIHKLQVNNGVFSRLKREDRVLLELSHFDIVAILNWIVIPTLFSFGYNYYAPTRMVASQLNHQIILLLKRPLTHYWTSPLRL